MPPSLSAQAVSEKATAAEDVKDVKLAYVDEASEEYETSPGSLTFEEGMWFPSRVSCTH